MELQEVRAFLAEHRNDEEVVRLLGELLNVDVVKRFVSENEEAQKWLQAEKDRAVSKGIETWKQKTLPTILEEEKEKLRRELNPEETPEQKELRKLKEEFERERRERQRAELRAQAKDYAQEKGLPSALIDHFIADDEEATRANLEKFAQVWSQAVQEAREGVFKEHGRTPHPPTSSSATRFTREQIEKMTPEELEKHWGDISKQLEESGGKLD